MKLTTSQQIKIMNHFASFKKRQGYKSIVLQSLPIMGVQADTEFYPLQTIIDALNKSGKLSLQLEIN